RKKFTRTIVCKNAVNRPLPVISTRTTPIFKMVKSTSVTDNDFSIFYLRYVLNGNMTIFTYPQILHHPYVVYHHKCSLKQKQLLIFHSDVPSCTLSPQYPCHAKQIRYQARNHTASSRQLVHSDTNQSP
ncbi:hypothetical protein PanWU01x14_087940, partial [Parasponia andersonii]